MKKQPVTAAVRRIVREEIEAFLDEVESPVIQRYIRDQNGKVIGIHHIGKDRAGNRVTVGRMSPEFSRKPTVIQSPNLPTFDIVVDGGDNDVTEAGRRPTPDDRRGGAGGPDFPEKKVTIDDLPHPHRHRPYEMPSNLDPHELQRLASGPSDADRRWFQYNFNKTDDAEFNDRLQQLLVQIKQREADARDRLDPAKEELGAAMQKYPNLRGGMT